MSIAKLVKTSRRWRFEDKAFQETGRQGLSCWLWVVGWLVIGVAGMGCSKKAEDAPQSLTKKATVRVAVPSRPPTKNARASAPVSASSTKAMPPPRRRLTSTQKKLAKIRPAYRRLAMAPTPRTSKGPKIKWRKAPSHWVKREHTIRRGDLFRKVLTNILMIKNSAVLREVEAEIDHFADLRVIVPGHQFVVWSLPKTGQLKRLRYYRGQRDAWQIDLCWKHEPCYAGVRKVIRGYQASKHYLETNIRKWFLEVRKLPTRWETLHRGLTMTLDAKTPTFVKALEVHHEAPELLTKLKEALGPKVDLDKAKVGDTLQFVVEKRYQWQKFHKYRTVLFARYQPKGKPALMLLRLESMPLPYMNRGFFLPDGKPHRTKNWRTHPYMNRVPAKLRGRHFAFPNKPFILSSHYGMRFHPILRRSRLHAGLDTQSLCGQPTYAVDAGVVLFAGWGGGGGRMVRLFHPSFGGVSTYLHFYRIAVKRGQRVRKGQLVGYVGQSGLASGCHLHLELKLNRRGKTTDPMGMFWERIVKREPLECAVMPNFWKRQLDSCKATGIPLPQCQMTLPARCEAKYKQEFNEIKKQWCQLNAVKDCRTR